jgi:hypothetical protein
VIGELRTMARPRLEEARGWIGLRVDDVYGFLIGEVAAVRTDPRTGEARWLEVRGGQLGASHTLVPFADASGGPENVWVPYERRTVREAPRIHPGDEFDDAFDRRLADHYAVARGEVLAPPRPVSRRRTNEPTHRLG